MKLILAAALVTVFPLAEGRGAAPPTAQTEAAALLLQNRVVKLENGLTLLLAPDPSQPNVGVELWLRGGAREERPGEHGAAHLFEHQLAGAPAPRLLTNPSNKALSDRVRRGGGAGTDLDYVNIYRIVDPEGLEVMLATLAEQLEVSEQRFTNERLKSDKDIVVSELRRSFKLEWDPTVLAHLHRGTFGADHPYGHSVSGSETHVKAASLTFMHNWLRRFGTGRNAQLFIVGNFDPAAAEAMVRRHFGSLPVGVASKPKNVDIPGAAKERDTIEVPFATGGVFLQWATPGWGTEDGDRLILFTRVLQDRLERTGRKASATVQQWELAGAFTIVHDAASASAAHEAEASASAELRKLWEGGPTAPELERAKAQWKTEFLLSLQNPVWRGSRTDALGRGLVFHGNPDHFGVQMSRIAGATAEEVQAAGAKWLGEAGYVLHALPEGAAKPSAVAQIVEPGPTIPPSSPREPRLPVIEQKKLPAGGKLVVAARPELPLARVTIAFPAGIVSDTVTTGGRARMVLSTLPDIQLRSGSSLAEGLAQIGGVVETNVDRDFASLSVTLTRDQVDTGVRMMLEALATGPSEASFREVLARQVQAASKRKSPAEARWQVAACALTTPCHAAYLTGAGTEDTMNGLSAETLASFYKSRYNRSNVLMIASGAAEGARLEKLLEGALPTGPAASKDPVLPIDVQAPRVRVIDSPGASQASLLLVQPLPEGLAADPAAAEFATLAFRQRLMEVLRTQKGWSYEMYPYGNDIGRSGSFLYMNIPIQTAKVALGIKEVETEAARLGKAPLDPGFFLQTKGYMQGALLRGLTSLGSMNQQLLEAERGGLPFHYHRDYLRKLPEVSSEQVRATAQALLDPNRFVWAIAGDLKQIGPALDAEKIPYTVVKPAS